MTITLYTTSDDPNVASKSLTTLGSGTGFLKENCSIEEPIFEFDGTLSTLVSCNYIHIADYSRYYFVREIVQLANNLCEFHCEVDPLMSFYSQIVATTQLIDRQENNYNLMLFDDKLPILSSSVTSIQEGSVEFQTDSGIGDNYHLIMCVNATLPTSS